MQPVRAVRRLCVAATLVAVAALAPLPTTTPPTGAAAAAPAPLAERASDACGDLVLKAGGGTWECTFVDDFEGARLNRRKWIVQDTARTGFKTGSTCYTPDQENVAVRGGALRLTARKGEMFRCGNLLRTFTTRYTGGMVGTKGKFSQTYGRFEVRAKWPTARTSGIHGGFWMNPVEKTYGRWPESGEIDIAEWWSSRPRLALPSLHYDGRHKDVDSGWRCRIQKPSRFHTYTLVWQKRVMRFSIDGKQCFARRWVPEPPQQAPQPFDHAFSMILNMGVGRKVGRQKVTPETEFPARYVVDYAKAWK